MPIILANVGRGIQEARLRPKLLRLQQELDRIAADASLRRQKELETHRGTVQQNLELDRQRRNLGLGPSASEEDIIAEVQRRQALSELMNSLNIRQGFSQGASQGTLPGVSVEEAGQLGVSPEQLSQFEGQAVQSLNRQSVEQIQQDQLFAMNEQRLEMERERLNIARRQANEVSLADFGGVENVLRAYIGVDFEDPSAVEAMGRQIISDIESVGGIVSPELYATITRVNSDGLEAVMQGEGGSSLNDSQTLNYISELPEQAITFALKPGQDISIMTVTEIQALEPKANEILQDSVRGSLLVYGEEAIRAVSSVYGAEIFNADGSINELEFSKRVRVSPDTLDEVIFRLAQEGQSPGPLNEAIENVDLPDPIENSDPNSMTIYGSIFESIDASLREKIQVIADTTNNIEEIPGLVHEEFQRFRDDLLSRRETLQLGDGANVDLMLRQLELDESRALQGRRYEGIYNMIKTRRNIRGIIK